MKPAGNLQTLTEELFSIRNQYGAAFLLRKKTLLEEILRQPFKNKKALEALSDTLLFLMAYPDDKQIHLLATKTLAKLESEAITHENLQTQLYNSGIAGSTICAEFGFEIVKWLRATYGKNVSLESITAPDGQILYILSAMMPHIESEILQDENSTWKEWLKQNTRKGDDLLDTLINIFDNNTTRPEVKDELWNALGIYITVNHVPHLQLPERITSIHYHDSLIKKVTLEKRPDEKPVKVKLTQAEAEKIIECGRMVLLRYIREIDPVSFSDPSLLSYYKLSHGVSIALYGMRNERRHPIDSYMGYVAFKNGLPVAYAGSWVLFDSARIGLNIFAPYRGGESLYIFEQILKLHKQAYRLHRFTADPYQIGKNNSDGIKSGAFWVYYKLGFRPMREDLQQLAEAEAQKILQQKGYRSSSSVLKKLADSRLELTVGKRGHVRFDANDLSVKYMQLVNEKYSGNRAAAQQHSLHRLLKLLKWEKLKINANLEYVLSNWSVILMANENTWRSDKAFIALLKKIVLLKAAGSEEEYIFELQRSRKLRAMVEELFR
ncbi:MAG: hypothetical protein V4615_07400 [Bacteroidota bacterium]